MKKKQEKVNLQKIILELLLKKKAVKLKNLTPLVEKEIPKDKNRKTKPEYIIRRTIKTLSENNFVQVYKTEQSSFIQITKAGKHKLDNLYLSGNEHLVPTKWDGKWRIVILDIKENDKQTRNALRYILKKANFLCLKNSVWISPYAFEHFLYNMKENLGLYNEMIILVTEYLDPISQEFVKEKFLKSVGE